MNKRKITTAIVSLSLALPLGVAYGQSGAGSTGTSSPSTSSGTSSSPSSQQRSSSQMQGSSTRSATSTTSTAQFQRTTKDRVEQQFTAKDLLDKDVYDSQGEKIGEITDISLGASFAGNLSSLTQHSGSSRSGMDASGRTSTSGSGASASGRVDTPVGSAGASGRVDTSDGGISASGSIGGASGASRSAMSSMSSQAEPAVYVSVGSVMGIGGDLVRVPLTALSYDSQEERFTLSARKAEITALAEADEDSSSVAATGSAGMSNRSATGSATGTSSSDSMSGSRSASGAYGSGTSSTTSAKEQFNDDTQKIKDALKSDSTLSSVASQITITASGNDLVISGTVQNQQQKDRALSLAKQHSQKNVRDQLQVSQNR